MHEWEPPRTSFRFSNIRHLWLKTYSCSIAQRTAKIIVALLFSCTLASTISRSRAKVVRGLDWEAEACQFRPRCRHTFVCTWGLKGVLLAGRGARTSSDHYWERCQMFTQGPVMNGWLLRRCTMPMPLYSWDRFQHPPCDPTVKNK